MSLTKISEFRVSKIGMRFFSNENQKTRVSPNVCSHALATICLHSLHAKLYALTCPVNGGFASALAEFQGIQESLHFPACMHTHNIHACTQSHFLRMIPRVAGHLASDEEIWRVNFGLPSFTPILYIYI